MNLKLIYAQQLDSDYITISEWMYEFAYPIDDYFIICREHISSSDSVSRWNLALRHKDKLTHFLGTAETPKQALPLKKGELPQFSQEQEKYVKDLFLQAGNLEDDKVFGFVEISPISFDASQILVFLSEGVGEEFASPLILALFQFILPTRKITKGIDPVIKQRILESKEGHRLKEYFDEDDTDKEESDGKTEEGVYRFSNQAIKRYEFEGKKPKDDLLIHMWRQNKTVIEISQKLSTPEEPYVPGTINNRIVILREILKEDVVPYRKRPKQ
jgi:hypothetical protein